jgi:hypothetical protein
MLQGEEEADLPWWTEEEEERTAQQLYRLKTNSYDSETNQYRDIRWMYFRPQVLEKYRNNELCDIGNEHISFLRYVYNKKQTASTVNFFIRDFGSNKPTNQVLMPVKMKPGMPKPKPELLLWHRRPILMMQAQEYVYVPPRQRRHWQEYELPQREIQFI